MSLNREMRWDAAAERLSVERAAYAGIALLALGLRLYALGQAPLAPAEAAQALPAWAAAAGQSEPLIGVSPLLWTAQRLAFTAFGAGEFWARALPALLGGLAPMLFWALRERLSRGGALIAALLWAISPLAVFTARLALGDSLVPPLALALMAFLSRFSCDGERADAGMSSRAAPLIWVAVTLGLLLISGRGAYTALLAGAIALVWRPALLVGLLRAARANRRGLLLAFLMPLVLIATFFLTEPAGLAAAGDLLGQWALGLRPGAGEYDPWEIVRRLLLSEPLLLGLGIGGAIRAWRHGDRFGQWASLAALIALAAASVGRGRQPVELALAVLGLALLAGPVMADLLRGVRALRSETDPWLLLALSCALLISALICLPAAWNPSNSEAWRRLYTAVGIVTASLAALTWLVYGIWGSWSIVARALPLAGLILGLVWGVGQTVGLSYSRAPGQRAGALATSVAPDAADLLATVRDLSALQGGGATDARVDLVWPERPGDPMRSVLGWLLRDFSGLRVAGAVPADPAPVVITSAEAQPALEVRYSGAKFPVLQTWRPYDLGGFNAILRWVWYREAKTGPETQDAVVWMDRTQE